MTFFESFEINNRILIVHPNYRNQKHALADLLKSESFVYVRFDGHELTQDDLNQQIYLAYQKAAISEIDFVVLDECDRAKKADFDDFLSDLISHIEPIPIVLFSRDLPGLILEDSSIAAMTRIWPVNPELMYPNYLAKSRANVLEVFGLSRGYARVNGVKIDNWRDEQSLGLFFFLVDRERVHREDIFKTFWPHLSTKSAANAFQITKSNINSQLGIELTDYHNYYYSINSQIELYYDVSQYRKLVQKADFSQEQITNKHYHDANSLYSGNFLWQIESDWIEERRNELKELQAGVLANIANQEMQDGNQATALIYFGRAAHFAPQREDVAYELMRLYLQSAMPCEALFAYKRLYQNLSTMGIKPSERLIMLAEQAEQQCSNL